MRFFALAFCLVLLGCVPSTNPQGQPPSGSLPLQEFSSSGQANQRERRPIGTPGDFFPIQAGSRWRYQIELAAPGEPLKYEEVSWPLGGRSLTYTTRGILYPLDRFSETATRGDRREFNLEMSVKGPAPKQGPLSYPSGVELVIHQDELGVFRGSKQVFWAVGTSERFMVNLVTTYPPNSPGAPTGSFGSWGQEDGSAIRLNFFGDKPGIQISRSGSPDKLLFEGLDAVTGHGAGCLRFKRTVAASDDARSDATPLDQGFTETTWFARGKGLVRLVQEVNGQLTMTWTLTDFSAGK